MKKKNGFTLIELLAIIVILAIIAVITVPIILNIIENSQKGAATDSAYGYRDAVNKWYVSKLQEDNQYQLDNSYTISSDGKLGTIMIPVSGDKPSGGYLNYSNNTLTGGCLKIGEYAVTFDEKGNVSKTEKGECKEEIVFTSFIGIKYNASWDEGEYFSSGEGSSYLPSDIYDNSSVWIQWNDSALRACAYDSNSENKICFDYNHYDCGEISKINNKLVCSENGYISNKLNEIYQMEGVECDYNSSTKELICDMDDVDILIAPNGDVRVHVHDSFGGRCDSFYKEGILYGDCN